MNLEALAAEVAKPEYEGLSDDEVAATLNSQTVTRTVSRFVNYRTMLADLGPEITLTVKGKIEAAAEVNPLLALIAPMLMPEAGGIDVGHPGTRAQIDALVAGGLFTADEATALKGMGEETITIGQSLGWGRAVWPGEVAEARRMNAND
jgi:hypothetical protein